MKHIDKTTVFAPWLRTVCGGLVWLLVLGVEAQPVTPQDWRYTVRPNDTVSGIARQYLRSSVGWKMLASYNRLTDFQVIRPGTQLRIPLHWLAQQQARAKVTAVSGNVQVQGIDGTWEETHHGQMLQVGQGVRVGRNSSARLQFADDSEMVIQPESTVILDTLSVYAGGTMADTRLRLQAGRVEVRANPKGRKGQKFDVQTPAAVASVRGTQFMVASEEGRTIEQTTRGQVILQTRVGSVVVPEGYGSAAKPGEGPQAPQDIQPAPSLQNPINSFTDFPIAFSWATQPDVTAWVAQVGRDPEMAHLVLTQQSTNPQFNAAALPDGRYHLRVWSLAAQGMPSKIAPHAFEVSIPRRQQGPAVTLQPSYFAAGPLALQLLPLTAGQRYLVQVTQDAAGRLPVWHMANADAAISVPVPAERDHLHYLWVWVY